MDGKFFSRCASWSGQGESFVVHDSTSRKAPRMITMDPWPALVFSAADGEHTVDEFVSQLGSQYEGGMPPGLREQIHGFINNLIAEGIVRLHDEATPLPLYFAEDYFAQPPEVRKQQLVRDGRLKG